MSPLRRLLPDRFLMILIATVAAATLLPARGRALEMVGWVSNAAIFLLFFLHGARLARTAVLDGFKRWHLQLAILGFGYALFPLLGLAASHALDGVIAPELLLGLLFLCVLPTTVQSSIAYASIARGNVAASVIASAASNLIGVIATPLLFALLASTAFGQMSFDGIAKIATLLLLPFTLGQLLRGRVLPAVERHARAASMMDKLTIILAVYVAFSGAAAEGLWSRIGAAELGWLALVVLALLLLALAAAWGLGALLGFDPADRATLLFAGAHKSLATGAPMARIFFPAATAGAIILPLLLYHQMQLMLSAMIAARLAKQDERIA